MYNKMIMDVCEIERNGTISAILERTDIGNSEMNRVKHTAIKKGFTVILINFFMNTCSQVVKKILNILCSYYLFYTQKIEYKTYLKWSFFFFMFSVKREK